MSRASNRGATTIEMALVGIPLIFVLISVFEMARGMWVYHTLAYAIKEGTRYASVHGQSCTVAPNSCSVTVGQIAGVIRDAGIGLDPTELKVQMQSNTAADDTGLQTLATLFGKVHDISNLGRRAGTSADHFLGSVSVPIGDRNVLAGSRTGIELHECHLPCDFARAGAVLKNAMERRAGQQGQAILLVTFSLVAMCGMLGLAVDLGWSYFVKKSAQATADAAALAGANAARRASPAGPPFLCESVFCSSAPVSCSSVASSSNASAACLYAQQMGFTDGSNNMSVTVAAGVTTPAPTAPGVSVSYWMTVRVKQEIPQLFSAVLGNTTGTVSARATGAVTNSLLSASLYLLNRKNDNSPAGVGVDINIQGSGIFQAPGGAFLASDAAGAATLSGAGAAKSPFTDIRGSGTCVQGNGQCGGQWSQAPTNGFPDGPPFWDPTNGKPQPPLDASLKNECPVKNGLLNPANTSCAIGGTGSAGDPYVLGPGKYYAVSSAGAVGGRLSFQGNTLFDGPAFGSYMFFGGLQTSPNQTVTFAPGQYVLAGTIDGTPDFLVGTGTTITEKSATGAGEMFIFTDTTYPGMSALIPSALAGTSFSYGQSGFKPATGGTTTLSLHGLTDAAAAWRPDLQPYEPFLLWQDRGDSHVAYDANGNIVISCGAGFSMDSPCSNPRVSASSSAPQMNLLPSGTSKLSGAIYQPRGAWLSIQQSGNIGQLQIVTGAFISGGNPILGSVTNPIKTPTVALIE